MNFYKLFYLLVILLSSNCAVLFYRENSIKPVEFNYKSIEKSHYTNENEEPFPLTVRSGNNIYNSTTKDGKYLFFASDSKGNFDVYLRDLVRSVVVPVTSHPAPQFKPSVSPDGKKLAFVSERIDPEGDIVLMDIDPEEWVKEYLKGKDLTLRTDYDFITNPGFKNPKNLIRCVDTDPSWSPDSRYVTYVSNCQGGVKTNITVYDTKERTKRTLTKDGGYSPQFSPDGKKIIYASYKDTKFGELYLIEVDSLKEIRLTNDNYINLDPSFSSDEKYIYYTSIRKDTNKNGKLDTRDSSVIVRYEVSTGETFELTAGNLSIFNTRYSNFNNGSILFSASINNSLNIYFIPDHGEIPKQKDIDHQYEISKLYRPLSVDFVKLAFNSIDLYYLNDPNYPIYKSRSERQMVKEYESEGKFKEAEQTLAQMIKKKYDLKFGFSYALAISHIGRKKGKDPIKELEEYYREMKAKSGVLPAIPPAINYLIGEAYYYGLKNPKRALEILNSILDEYPDFYRKLEVKRIIGKIEFDADNSKVPEYYSQVLAKEISTRDDNIFIYQDIQKNLSKKEDPKERFKLADSLGSSEMFEKNPELWALLQYIKADSLRLQDLFQESNTLIDSYLSKIEKNSYVALKSYLLKFKNFKNLNQIEPSQFELKRFVDNYNYDSGAEVNQEDLESSIYYFETRARQFEIDNNLKGSFQSYTYNNDFLSKAAINHLPIDKLKKEYAPYYQKKMVDAGLRLARSEQEKNDSSILSQINILGQGNLDLAGRSTSTVAWFSQKSFLRFFGDFRDFQQITYFDSESLELLDSYYKDKLEKSRASLELSTVLGYAYYLISKASSEEKNFVEKDVLTYARKKRILEQFKQAEYELKWLIYADPDFTDAYLLLGWLHQYIEVRKQTLLTTELEEDRVVFKKLYESFFPSEYLTENINLYDQILAFNRDKASKKVLADINLNLGNTYFMLNNPEKALNHYTQVDKLSRFIIEKKQFETYNQKALFYFNYARANVYNGKVEEAVPLLNSAIELYYKNEYYPLVSKIGTKKEKSEYYQKFLETKQKLVVLHALHGIVQMSLENYSDAILSLTTSLSLNGDSDHVEDISLYNNLAICYQKIGDYEKSEKALSLADKEYVNSRKLVSQFFNFNFWEIVSTDSQRVIGEGRFPNGFPLDFSNLLTQGIRIKNFTDKREFNKSEELIEKRKKFITSKSLDKKFEMGSKILDNSLNEAGFNEFLRGSYFKAASIFTQDYQNKKKQSKVVEAYKAYLRSDISLYSHIEENSGNISEILKELLNNIKFLNGFKKDYIKSCLPGLIERIRQKESTNIQKECENEFYKNFKEYDTYLGYNYLYLGDVYRQQKEIEKSFQFYGQALVLLKNPSGISDEEVGLPTDPFSMKERTRLKILTAIIYQRLDDKEKFSKTIQEAYFIASEFIFERELLAIYLIQAEYAYINAKDARGLKNSLDFANSAELLLRNSPSLFEQANEIFINNLYQLRIRILIRKGDFQELSSEREKLYSAIFFRQMLVNELRFQDKNVFITLNELQQDLEIDSDISNEIEQVNSKRGNSKYLLKAKEKNYSLFLKHLEELKSYSPKGMDFDSWLKKRKVVKPKPKQDEIILEFFTNGNDFILFSYYLGKTETLNFSVKDKNNLDDISNAISKALDNKTSVKKIVIISSPLLYNVNFNKLLFRDKVLNDYYSIRYLFRLSQIERESLNLEFSRLRRITSVDTKSAKEKQESEDRILFNPLDLVYSPPVIPQEKIKELNLRIVPDDEIKNYLTDTDILEGPTDFINRKHYIGEKRNGYLHLKEVVENEWNIPLIVINNYNRSLDNFIKTGFLYDILQFAGVQSIVFMENSTNTSEIRNNLISNIKNSNQIIQKNNLILVGEAINPYPENERVYEEEFKRFTKIALSFERKKEYLESMKNLLLANSVLPDNRPDLSIDSELNIVRLKTYLFPEKDYLVNYSVLLEKFGVSSTNGEKILYDALMRCYESHLDIDCGKYYSRLMSHPDTTEDRKYIITFYKNLREGNLKYIDSEYNKFISMDTKEDSFLKNMKMAYLFSRGFIWDKAVFHAKEAKKFANSDREKFIAENRLSEIDSEIYFIKGVDPNPPRQDKLYYLSQERVWAKYRERVKELLKYETNFFKKNYKERIYSSLEGLENEAGFEITSLAPIFLKSGNPSIILLKEADRNFLFHVLLKSIPYQTGQELNNQFDVLVDTEINLKNKNRSYWMYVVWASSLFQRGDTIAARDYLKKFENILDDSYPEKNLLNNYFILKYKLSKVYPEISNTTIELNHIRENFKVWFSFYEEVTNSNPEKFYSIIENLLQLKKELRVDIANEREFFDFLNFMKREALVKNSNQVFLDLGFYAEKLKHYNDKVFGRAIKFSDLPNPRKNVTEKIIAKMNKSHSFKALIDLGIITYKASIIDSNVMIEKVFDDNRDIKFKILDYLFSIKKEGASEIKQETIETIYRKAISLEKNRLTYLFLPSYHFKAQIEPEEQDHFYYVINPEKLIDRPIYDTSKDLLPNFKSIVKKNPSNNKGWNLLKELEEFEIKASTGTGNGNSFLISQEMISLKENKKLFFADRPLYSLTESPRVGPWILTGSRLYQTSLHNDDYVHSLYFIDNLYHGPAVISTGTQEDTHTAYFLKTFLKKKSFQDQFFERFLDTYIEVEYNQLEDRFWIGWKPYTNTFLNAK
ncbi:MAG: tetratricopeptide repeat protein [Leptospiraceae bacterium]|nr:tetratricopeptide repeat protein [Leptospiraceae bacterium]